MSLLGTLTIALGPSIAKAMLKSWLGEGLQTTLAGKLVDLLKDKRVETKEQREAAQKIDKIGEQVVARVRPIFEHEAQELSEPDREVVILEAAETLVQAEISVNLLVDLVLDSSKLTRHLLKTRSDAIRMLSTNQERFPSLLQFCY